MNMSSCQTFLRKLLSADSRKARHHGRFLLLASGLVWLSCFAAAQSLPTDVNTTCIVTPSTFAGWFQTNTVTLNGVVNPANSLTFVPNSNCSFFQWSEQMFLWLNSPAPASYGGSGPIFNSPAFFDVSPLNSSNQRTLIAHTSGIFRPFPLPVRASKVGPHGLQVKFDKAGRMIEVQPAKLAPSGKPLIFNAAGKEVEIERANVENGKAVFLDKLGKPISGAKPILKKSLQQKTAEAFRLLAVPVGKFPLPAKENPVLVVQRFIINGIPIFIDGLGNLDPVEQGEADDSILETQNCSLVYYTIAVNDVYAYFLTGIKTGAIPSNPATLTFPVNQSELTAIQNFAITKGVTFPDPDALAVEVKASWVDASTLPDPNDYITISANIPTYTPSVGPSNCASASNATTWTNTGTTKMATLALVGMHVVGTVQGHPELIWATFEHVNNTPLATYTYNGSTGVETVTQSTSGTWLFSATGSTGPFNQAHMQTSGANIQAVSPTPPNPPPPFTISPSNTLRMKPFGGATDLQPLNLSEFNATAANTDVISINNSVRGQLISPDVRAQYIFSGATWTAGGVAPTFNTALPPNNNSNQVGNSFLANSTMETYVQGPDSTSQHGAMNCFNCHNDSGQSNPLSPNVDFGLSHIYFDLQPLP
jgi:hypothetical protein